MVHSSMRSPSPTCVLLSCSTAFGMFSGFFNSTWAYRAPSAPRTKRTDETPPNSAKTKRTCFSVQLSGKSRTEMQGPLGSPSPASFGAAAAPAGAEDVGGTGAGFAGSGGRSTSSAKRAAICFRRGSAFPCSRSRGQAAKCRGPPSEPQAASAAGGGVGKHLPPPAKPRSAQPPADDKPGKRFETTAAMESQCCDKRSDNDHVPCTLPSSSSTGNAARRPTASSWVLKRT
mmetsp:Transcript_26819/g.77289  ORF Transcript_26819/g.77289 Transcript_26819/m.77289 type:complete len:230 (+) Transcript_26819:598-1287(+)